MNHKAISEDQRTTTYVTVPDGSSGAKISDELVPQRKKANSAMVSNRPAVGHSHKDMEKSQAYGNGIPN
jgi:hypothetical protein